MFIIADIRHKFPSYFWKLAQNSQSLISMDIKNAKIFDTYKEAQGFLSAVIQEDNIFVFTVCELGIKNNL